MEKGPQTQFFNISELTPAQLARYPRAVARFNEIQADNIERTVAEWKAAGTHTEDRELRLLAKSATHRPGEHSALFSRLLNGDNPLEFPPPLVYGYPCYELVEAEFSMIVSLGGLVTDPENTRIKRLLVSQALWELNDMNDAAKSLLQFEAKHKLKYKNAGKNWEDCLLPAEHAEMIGIFAKKPEFILKNKYWGLFKLYIGRKTVVGHKETLLQNKGSFSDVDLNVTISSTDNLQDWVSAELDGWALEHIKQY